jgi:diadenosine tetraphosphatase ApaH/serine/threonine PP2A family protein phosphatase
VHVAVISDIHSNLAAFEAVIADWNAAAAEWEYTIDEVWCLGDVVGYGPEPNECIQRLQQFEHEGLAGNHDWAALGKVSTADFNPEARAAAQWTSHQLTDASRRYLEVRPLRIVRDAYTLAHGSPRDPIWEYVITASQASANFDHYKTPYCFVGHSHLPLIYRQSPDGAEYREPDYSTILELGSARLIINPGSVGQPRDGNPDASYAILDTTARRIEYRRVPYDIAATQQKMRDAALPPRLWQRLSRGR